MERHTDRQADRGGRLSLWTRNRKWVFYTTLLVVFAINSIRPASLQLVRATTNGEPGTDASVAQDSGTPARAVTADGKITGTDLAAAVPEIDWVMLSSLNMQSGRAPAALDTLNHRSVRILGFVLPLDDMTDATATFLLVPYVGACVHTPPPPPNQLVQVVMRGGVRVPVSWWTPVYIEGVLEIRQVDSPYGKASFFLDGAHAVDYQTKHTIQGAVLY